jgi:hypothetical protein
MQEATEASRIGARRRPLHHTLVLIVLSVIFGFGVVAGVLQIAALVIMSLWRDPP